MLLIIGASGKLGLATLRALLDHSLLPPREILCTTSSNSGAERLTFAREQGVQILTGATWDDPSTFEDAFQKCDKLFLISSPDIQKDFNDAPPGKGREIDHYAVLEAAKKAGISHVYYTSLAFANPSKSRVMKAHERTEKWLASSGMRHTILREGLYNESWPLYLGHHNLLQDDRREVKVAGDSPISWTAISDLGVATAIILSAPSDEWASKAFYLAQEKTHTLKDVASMVSKVQGHEVALKIVSREEHENHYVKERDMDDLFIKWWSKTYDALNENECDIHDPTLEQLLEKKGLKPVSMEETVRKMLSA